MCVRCVYVLRLVGCDDCILVLSVKPGRLYDAQGSVVILVVHILDKFCWGPPNGMHTNADS